MITTYATLQAKIAEYLAREDQMEEIKTYINMAELRMARRVVFPSEQDVATVSITSDGGDLPADLRSTVLVRDELGTLSFVPVSEFYSDKIVEGRARYYTIVGTKIHVKPAPSEATDYTIVYGTGITHLSEDVDSTPVLVRYADLYLYGALKEAYTALSDEQNAVLFDGHFNQLLEEVRVDTQNELFGSAPLVVVPYVA